MLPGGLDREALLAPIAQDDACGEDLEYDRDFTALIEDSKGTPPKVRYELDPETRREVPRILEKGRDPDWGDIAQRVGTLMQRSKDLRLALLLARGGLAIDGFPGFAAGIDLMRALLDDYWDGVYPRLEEDGDATLRTNSVSDLAEEALLGRVYRTPLVDAPRIGRFSLRDLAVAAGEAKPETEGTVPTTEAIDAAFATAPADALRAVGEALRGASASINDIKRLFNDRTEFQFSPNLDGLVRHLRDAATEVERRLEARGETQAGGEEEPDGTAADDEASDAPVAVRRGSGPVGQAITGRADVVKMLDAICAWYAEAEPSSPVPVLLKRARNLVDKSFMDLIRDLAPAAIEQIQVYAGPDAESSGDGY